MKGRSIKNRFILIFLTGALFVIFITSIGIYGTLKGRGEAARLYEDNLNLTKWISHLREEMRNTRVELVTMTIERETDKMIPHKTNMEILDADITADFDEFIKGGHLRGQEAVLDKFIEAKSVWMEFYETRHGRLIPIMLGGEHEKAMSLARGIQQERYLMMRGLLNEVTSGIDGYLAQKHREMEARGRSLVIGIILLTGVGFISGAVIFYAYSGDIINRIKSLESASRTLADGDLSTRIQVKGEDEIALLGNAFNNMAETIQEDIDIIQKNERELQGKNAMLNEAMIEREQHSRVIEYEAQRREEQNKKLQDAVLELETMNRQLTDTQAQLLSSEKMASIGQLAAGVAHEINNPVGFINGNMSTLSAYIKDITSLNTMYEDAVAACREGKCEKVRELEVEIKRFREEKDMEFVFEDLTKLVSESRHGLERITSIVKDLKSFSHIGEAEAKEFDINKGLESTINIAWNEIKYKADVKKDYGNIPMVYCYPQQLNQVFMNIVVNAAHAMEEASGQWSVASGQGNGKGLIKIKTYHDNDSVFVEISDNGCGIPEDKIRNIFDPFFTTKPVGKGTGLGLSLAYNIIKKHNGEIGVTSKVGEGTTFTIRLPVKSSLEEMSS